MGRLTGQHAAAHRLDQIAGIGKPVGRPELQGLQPSGRGHREFRVEVLAKQRVQTKRQSDGIDRLHEGVEQAERLKQGVAVAPFSQVIGQLAIDLVDE